MENRNKVFVKYSIYTFLAANISSEIMAKKHEFNLKD